MPLSDESDVCVVGGGPAGLAAAIALREKGLSVTVIDCAQPPIDKTCGEGLMADSLVALNGLGVRIDPAKSWVFRGIRFIGAGVSVAANFPAGCGIGVRRTVLHQAMIDRAAEVGVETLWGARVTGLTGDGVSLDGHSLRCRWIIGADGQQSRVRRWAGLERFSTRSARFSFRRHYLVRPWSEYVEIYWGEDCQAYVTPVGAGEVCLAIISHDPHKRIDRALDAFPELRNRFEGAESSSTERGAVSATCRLRNVAAERVALLGDASGSVDAITGEGLCLAFRQAQALASALSSGNLSEYETAHRKLLRRPAFMGELMLSLDRFGWLRNQVLPLLAARPSIFEKLLAAHVGALCGSHLWSPSCIRV